MKCKHRTPPKDGRLRSEHARRSVRNRVLLWVAAGSTKSPLAQCPSVRRFNDLQKNMEASRCTRMFVRPARGADADLRTQRFPASSPGLCLPGWSRLARHRKSRLRCSRGFIQPFHGLEAADGLDRAGNHRVPSMFMCCFLCISLFRSFSFFHLCLTLYPFVRFILYQPVRLPSVLSRISLSFVFCSSRPSLLHLSNFLSSLRLSLSSDHASCPPPPAQLTTICCRGQISQRGPTSGDHWAE